MREISREEVQKECFEHWIENNCRTLVNACTGLGKSLIMIQAVEYTLNQSKEFKQKALIIAHSIESRDITIPNEFKKFGRENLLAMCDIICYASLRDLKSYSYSIITCDEAHYLTENNSSYLYNNPCEKYMFLTATLPEEDEKLDILWNFAEARYSLHVDDAIESKILNDYKIFIKYVDLDNKLKILQPYKTKGLMTEKEAYTDITRKIEYFQKMGQYKVAEMMRLKRMHLIYDSFTKLKAAVEVKSLFTDKNKRFIMFCGSTKTADQLSKYTYHSKSSRKDYEKFITGEVNELASVKKIKEGANIPELDGAIIVQLNSKELNITQMIGRLLRGKPGEVKPIILIVLRGSVDQSWVESALRNFDQSKIQEL